MRVIPARYFYRGRKKPIRLIVIHAMQSGEKSDTAENVAKWFADPNTRRASAHVCVDNNSAIRCVADGDTAWGAKGANADGLHLEHAGRSEQSKDEWLDSYGTDMLDISAVIAAEWAKKYMIPTRWLTVEEVRDGKTKGFTDHGTVSKAFKGTGHTDPGPHFPRTFFMERVRTILQPLPPVAKKEVDVLSEADKKWIKVTIEEVVQRHISTVLGNVGEKDTDLTHRSISDLWRQLTKKS